jgi:ATP-binding cassette subfamily F protein uup
VLDEPTNDLDVETLEALEDRLADYDGTLIVVSHDRYFLDAVVTSTLVFEEDGQIRRHAGGYSDWVARGRALAVVDAPDDAQRQRSRAAREPRLARKLSYHLQRELDALPDRITVLEQRVAELRLTISLPDFYKRPAAEVQQTLDALGAAEQDLDAAVERWAELEQLAAAAANAAQRPSDD